MTAACSPFPNKHLLLYQLLKQEGVTKVDIDACCTWAKEEIKDRLSSHLSYTYTKYVEALVRAIIIKKSLETAFPAVTFNPAAQPHTTINYKPGLNWYKV